MCAAYGELVVVVAVVVFALVAAVCCIVYMLLLLSIWYYYLSFILVAAVYVVVIVYVLLLLSICLCYMLYGDLFCVHPGAVSPARRTQWTTTNFSMMARGPAEWTGPFPGRSSRPTHLQPSCRKQFRLPPLTVPRPLQQAIPPWSSRPTGPCPGRSSRPTHLQPSFRTQLRVAVAPRQVEKGALDTCGAMNRSECEFRHLDT